jgi:hypothetical protein
MLRYLEDDSFKRNRYIGRFYNEEWTEDEGSPSRGSICYGDDWYESMIPDGETFLWKDPKTDWYYSQVECLYSKVDDDVLLSAFFVYGPKTDDLI